MEKKKACPFFLLENSRPLSPWGPLDSLSTCLGTDSLKRLMLVLKLQYFGHLRWRTDSVEKTRMLGETEGGRRRGWQRMRWLDGITDSVDISLSKFCDKSWKMMLWKCCTQYATKFGNLSGGHRTGKGQFSFQSQRRAMLKNVQTTTHFKC